MNINKQQSYERHANTFGIPDTSASLGLREVGIALARIHWASDPYTGLFPHLIPPTLGSWLVLACWLGLPVRSILNRKPTTELGNG